MTRIAGPSRVLSRWAPWLGGVTLAFGALACAERVDDAAALAAASADLRGPAECAQDGGAAGSAATAQMPDAYRHHHHHHARCGDGVVQRGEQCDDGNTQDADGCSSACRFDDDLATPGDDRPGFMFCAGESCATNGPCCGDVSAAKRACLPEGEECTLGSSECDGPEDCANGQICWEARWALCSAPDSLDPRGAQRCHRDTQCAAGQSCDEGMCRAS